MCIQLVLQTRSGTCESNTLLCLWIRGNIYEVLIEFTLGKRNTFFIAAMEREREYLLRRYRKGRSINLDVIEKREYLLRGNTYRNGSSINSSVIGKENI